MYCQNCGTEITGRFCPKCGLDSSAQETNINDDSEVIVNNYYYKDNVQNEQPQMQPKWQRDCPRCQSLNVKYQTITEPKKAGCLIILLYIILALSCIGWLILIPLLLRKKNDTATYAVCQACGYRWKIN